MKAKYETRKKTELKLGMIVRLLGNAKLDSIGEAKGRKINGALTKCYHELKEVLK